MCNHPCKMCARAREQYNKQVELLWKKFGMDTEYGKEFSGDFATFEEAESFEYAKYVRVHNQNHPNNPWPEDRIPHKQPQDEEDRSWYD